MSIQVLTNPNNNITGFKVLGVVINNATYGEMMYKVLGSGNSKKFKLAYAQGLALMHLKEKFKGCISTNATIALERLYRVDDVMAFTFSNEHGALITIDNTGGLHNYIAGETNNAASMFAIKRATSMLPSVWMFAATARLTDVYTKLGADKERLLFDTATILVRNPFDAPIQSLVYCDVVMDKLIGRMAEVGYTCWDTAYRSPDTPIDERAED